MSILFLDIGCKDVAIGLITIAIASVCASAERILEMIDNKSETRDDNDDFYGIAWLVVPLLASIIVVGILKRSEIAALIIFLSLSLTYLSFINAAFNDSLSLASIIAFVP